MENKDKIQCHFISNTHWDREWRFSARRTQYMLGYMLDMLLDWIKNDPRGEEYRDLDWSKEYDLARNGDPNDTQTAL